MNPSSPVIKSILAEYGLQKPDFTIRASESLKLSGKLREISTNKTLHLNSALINEFYLTPIQSSTLDKYYTLHWNGSYLKHCISVHGTIIHQDVEYIVILPDCVKAKFFEAPQVKLSFRKPKGEFNIPPYVLVRFA